jgi:hypothetical protein
VVAIVRTPPDRLSVRGNSHGPPLGALMMIRQKRTCAMVPAAATAVAALMIAAGAGAEVAVAATLDYDPATLTMSYTGDAGPDVPKWSDASGGWVQISDEKPMQPTSSVYANCSVLSPQFIQCPTKHVIANLGAGDDRAGGPNTATDDTLIGGDGDDMLVGGAGADRIDGGPGDDDLYPQRDSRDFTADGPDQVVGGPGTDTVNYLQVGGELFLTLDGRPDDGRPNEGDNVAADVENVYSSSSDDLIIGSAAANWIEAGAGKNMISGGDGDDTLIALVGDDLLSGDAGADLLLAGTGHNILDGGAGLDRFGPSAVSCDIFDCGIGIDEVRARDGVQEAINCLGIAGSKAIVDALDTVANCSIVDLPPRPSPPPPPPPPLIAKPTVRTSSWISRRQLLRAGVSAALDCPAACDAHLVLSRGPVTLAQARIKLVKAGARTVRLRVNRKAARRLRGRSRLTLSLSASVAAGHETTRTVAKIAIG